MEFDWLDLPTQARTTGGWLIKDNRKYLYASTLLECYLVAFAEFGLPKELLLVGGTGVVRRQETSTLLRGWEKLKFVGDPNIHEPGKSEAVLQYVHDNWYFKRDEILWFQERLPDVKIVGVQKEGESVKLEVKNSELFGLGDEAARDWQNKEYQLHGREWNSSIDGSPYSKVNMERALARARMQRMFGSA